MSVNWTEIVERAFAVRVPLELPRNIKLPCLPQSVIEFTSISNDPAAGPEELAKAVQSDSALTAALLRQVNSTATGLPRRVASVAQAINLLGTRRTRNLVLASALQTASAKFHSALISHTRFQLENRTRAVFAFHAAQQIGADAEIANLAGMLQDFMLPLLTEAFSSEYHAALESQRDLIQEEQQRFGWTHASVAAWVMHDWGFPEDLVACVLLHHDAERVLSDESLRESSIGAAFAAACLPESLGQSPAGFESLMRLQKEVSGFCMLTAAADVDDELDPEGHGDSLCTRLGKLAQANLEQQRLDTVNQYRKLGSYVLQDKLGEGAMGVIYRAQHDLLKRSAAIKVLRSTNISTSSLAQFETEVQLTCQLTSPNTVQVYDYGVTPQGLFYYVMEFMEGVTLDQIVRRSGPLPEGRVIHFLRQACNSLAEAHSLRLIHRDLKPENIMVCTRGGVPDTIKVLDFGLARISSRTPERDHIPASLSGTPNYMSPESVLTPKTIDGRSDLYSLGAVGYFLLTGTTVFPATTIPEVLQAHAFAIPVPPSQRIHTPIDADLEGVIMQCLSKAREARPANAAVLGRMLDNCQSAGTWNPFEAPQTRFEQQRVGPQESPFKSPPVSLGDTVIRR